MVTNDYMVIPYTNFKELRSATDAIFLFEENTDAITLRARFNGLNAACTLDKGLALYDEAEAARLEDFENNVRAFGNLPIEQEEVRFQTHDFSNIREWDGRTHGDQVAYLAGGVLKHPVDGSWLDGTGAAMIAAYATPGSGHTGDPTYLFGAWLHRISAVYDDVNYRWMSGDGTTRYVWLDTSSSPAVWKDDEDTVVVHFDEGAEQWVRDADDAVVTNSLWRILPYENYKIRVNKTKTTMDITAEFTGVLHYKVYMDLDAGVAGPGCPAGNYKVRDWQYRNLAELVAGSDRDVYIEPDVREGHVGKIMTLSYDYQAATKTPVIDSMRNMHLDILLDNDTPVTDTLGAGATFICMKIRSF